MGCVGVGGLPGESMGVWLNMVSPSVASSALLYSTTPLELFAPSFLLGKIITDLGLAIA